MQSHAGIRLWVLTGDKIETAINIGYACNLIHGSQLMQVVNSEDLCQLDNETKGVGRGLSQKSFETKVLHRLEEVQRMFHREQSKGSHEGNWR